MTQYEVNIMNAQKQKIIHRRNENSLKYEERKQKFYVYKFV